MIVFPSGGTLHDLAIHQQVESGVPLVVAAADSEGDVTLGELELRRSERAYRSVTVYFAAGHHAVGVFNLEPGQQTTGNRAGLEGGAGHLPVAIISVAEAPNRHVCGTSAGQQSKWAASVSKLRPRLFLRQVGIGSMFIGYW